MVVSRMVWRYAAAIAFSGICAHAEDISSGTGFIISPDGYILTCNHVIKDAEAIGVVLPDGRKILAAYVDGSEEKDLALIKIPADKLPILPLGDSNKAEVTDEVMALGYPLISELGADLSVGSGTINAKRENTVTPLLQVDLMLNSGNSGGPVLNAQGEVIGVAASRLNPVAMLARSGNMSERVNFAIPINEAGWLVRKAYPLGKPELAPVTTTPTKKEIVARSKAAVVLVFAKEKAKVADSVPVQRAEPVKEAVPDTETPEEHVRDFLQFFIMSGESGEHDAIGIQMAFYRYPVPLYFDDKNVSEANVRKDIEEYRAKWPTRKYAPAGKFYINEIPKYPGAFFAKYQVEFDVQSSSKRVRGLANYEVIVVRRTDGAFNITAITEKVVKRSTSSK